MKISYEKENIFDKKRLSELERGLRELAQVFCTSLPNWVKDELKAPFSGLSVGEVNRRKNRIVGWQRLLEYKEDLRRIRELVASAKVPPSEKNLYLAYISLSTELEFENLIRNPAVGMSTVRAFDAFYEVYRERYKEYHTEREKEKLALRKLYNENLIYANTIMMLSQIEGLCDPQMIERAQKLFAYEEILKECPEEGLIQNRMVCARCGAVLGESLPADEINSLIGSVQKDISLVLQKISRSIIKGIVRKEKNEKIKAFVDAVTVSNLEHFSRLLDPELLEFLKEILKSTNV